MKHIFLGGGGSIGQRHIANLRALRPDAEILVVDPNVPDADYSDISLAPIMDNVVYICSPTACHYWHFIQAVYRGALAIFVEKPLFDKSYFSNDTYQGLVTPPSIVTVGYNHRLHPLFREIKNKLADNLIYLHLYGSEDISAKYGVTPLETMLSHSIDLALWICGDALVWRTYERDICAMVGIKHSDDLVSYCHADMGSSFRVATITALVKNAETVITKNDKGTMVVDGSLDRHHWFIEPNDQMYVDEMAAWLKYVETGEPGDLCTFQQALKVQEIMAGSLV